MSTEIREVTKVPVTAPVNPARDDSQRAFAFAPSKVSKSPAGDSAQLQHAVEELNRHFAGTSTDLKFSIEKDLDVIVVSVVDAKDGTVLRQMPTEEALHLARVLKQNRSNLIEAVA